MNELQHTISAEELFGTASHLAAQEAAEASLGIASLGIAYQVAVAVVALFLIFALVRYYEVFLHILLLIVNPRTKRPSTHIFAAEIRNIEIVLGVSGVILLSLLVVRFTVLEGVRPLMSPLLELGSWGLGILSAGAISATILAEYGLIKAIGAVGGAKKFCNEIWHIKMLNFGCTMLLASPIILVMLLGGDKVASVALYALFSVCSITIFFFLKETFLLFRAQRVSIFHWFLYLCALEILPLSLLVAPIVRGEW